MSLAQSDRSQGQSRENSGGSVRVIVAFHLWQKHHSLCNDLMDLCSGFCFTLQLVKSSSEKILSCKILLGRKLRTKIQCLSIFWLVFQQKLNRHPCTSPYKRSVAVVFLGSSPTGVNVSCQHRGPVTGRGVRRGIAGSLLLPGKC